MLQDMLGFDMSWSSTRKSLEDEEVEFLRGHISQLSEKITPALSPGQEEAKRKGWWQFWK
jgi:hypothetical protein